jgi:WD40 repeat protein
MLDKDVHIWVAQFESKKRLDAYMREHIGDPDEETPISEFGRDQKECFYDHDLVYAEHFRKATMQELIECWRLPEKTVAQIGAAIQKLGVAHANVSFIAEKTEFDKPRSAKGKGYQLWYIGLFDARPTWGSLQLRPDDHQEPINECYVVAGGKFGLTTSRDAVMKLWDLKTGKLIDTRKHPGTILEDQNNWVKVLCSAPNGKDFLTYETGLAWWQPSSRGLKLLSKFASGHTAGVSGGIIDAAGKRLVTASFDSQLIVRDLKGGKPKKLAGHKGRIHGLASLPNRRVLSLDDKGEFRLWDLDAGETKAAFTIPGSTPRVLYVTKDGKTAIVATFKDTLLVVDLQKGIVIKDLYKGISAQLDRLAVTPDERLVVAVTSDDSKSPVRVWNLRSRKLVQTMLGHQGEMQGLAVTQDGRRAVTVACDANLIVWNLQTGKEIVRFRDAPADRPVPASYDPDGYMFQAVAISPAGNVVVAGEYSGRVRILRVAKNALTVLR